MSDFWKYLHFLVRFCILGLAIGVGIGAYTLARDYHFEIRAWPKDDDRAPIVRPSSRPSVWI